jgi:hypothetical protein
LFYLDAKQQTFHIQLCSDLLLSAKFFYGIWNGGRSGCTCSEKTKSSEGDGEPIIIW